MAESTKEWIDAQYCACAIYLTSLLNVAKENAAKDTSKLSVIFRHYTLRMNNLSALRHKALEELEGMTTQNESVVMKTLDDICTGQMYDVAKTIEIKK